MVQRNTNANINPSQDLARLVLPKKKESEGREWHSAKPNKNHSTWNMA